MAKCLIILLLLAGCTTNKKILVLSETAGFRHDSIETGVEAVQKICNEEGWEFTATEDSSKLISEQYDCVVFLSTTGDILNDDEQAHLKNFVEHGGGFVGIHAAANTEEEWDWFADTLLGATFVRHDPVKPLVVEVVDECHLSTSHLPSEWPRVDEWYIYNRIPENVKVLLMIEDKDGRRPIAWCRAVKEGKTFYTGGGHTKAAWQELLFLQHVQGGIEWSITP